MGGAQDKLRRLTLALYAVVAVAATGCDQLAAFRTHDRFGPIPRFGWIEAGQPRPTPHIAETTTGLSSNSSCYDRLDGVACLRRNWLGLLASFGETELTSQPNWRSYRLLQLPACSRLLAVRLDLRPDGSGLLTTAWTPPPSREGPTGAATRAQAPVSAAESTAVTAAFEHGGFNELIADPSALWRSGRVYDGVSWVLEAYVGGRYRYVARYSGLSDEAHVAALATPLLELARRKASFPAEQPC
jgi:hypothetical protein